MDTKIQSATSSAPEVSVEGPPATSDEVASSATASVTPRLSRRRLQLGAGAAIGLVLTAVLANNFIASQYTPEGAVRSYLGALQSRNAAAAWDQVQISASASSSTASVT